MSAQTVDQTPPEMRAAYRLIAIAGALHRHDGHEMAAAFEDLARSLTDSGYPAAQVARRDVALAILAEET